MLERALATGLLTLAIRGPLQAWASITEVIDDTGDGNGKGLSVPFCVAIGSDGSVYTHGLLSHNAFRIRPNGFVSEIIDANGDGLGKPLMRPEFIAVNAADEIFVSGSDSSNVFLIVPPPIPAFVPVFGVPGAVLLVAFLGAVGLSAVRDLRVSS